MTARTTTITPLSQKIIQTCCAVLGEPVSRITGPQRREPYTHYRKIVVVELREAGYSLSEVGRMLNGRHHSTIIQATREYSNLYDTWPAFRAKADACRAAVNHIFPHTQIDDLPF